MKKEHSAIEALDIKRPTLLIDEQKVRRNIEKMKRKADFSQVLFRPHFKTHQSAEIGSWFKEQGIDTITVSSLDMANYFADNGFTDITVAIPCNLLEIEKINTLAKKITLGIVVDSLAVVTKLDAMVKAPLNIWIKVDVGYGRAGIAWNQEDEIVKCALAISKSSQMKCVGLLTHSGHSYKAKSRETIEVIYDETIDRLHRVKKACAHAGSNSLLLSLGDTPCCSIVDTFEEVDEIRPGNFVFYDLTQWQLGSCNIEDIAVTVACPIISKSRDRKQIVLYGGAVHLSKDSLTTKDGDTVYGYCAQWGQNTWEGIESNAPLISLSQEHGVVQVHDDTLFNSMNVGDTVIVYPIHSCLAVDLYSEYVSIDNRKITKGQSNAYC